MPIYYDDNYGVWDNMDEPGMLEFYQDTQHKSILKECQGCGEMVKIRPEYGYCDRCATIREQGGEF